jgi:hypothetical protein
MRVATRNIGGRSVVRAERPLGPNSFGYTRWSDGQGALYVAIDGQDGKSYRIELTDADLDAARIARHEIYADAFKR